MEAVPVEVARSAQLRQLESTSTVLAAAALLWACYRATRFIVESRRRRALLASLPPVRDGAIAVAHECYTATEWLTIGGVCSLAELVTSIGERRYGSNVAVDASFVDASGREQALHGGLSLDALRGARLLRIVQRDGPRAPFGEEEGLIFGGGQSQRTTPALQHDPEDDDDELTLIGMTPAVVPISPLVE
ncbi:hypothetical protein EMIHUDRAFT_228708 [Emiliania huxleyi CCMP1516]|uniref:Uncharacterized protein n=2 Tax=Emiliania huxleyi TaxID=2903 RepID=A0A0D3KEB3_EMIH1|nr:hypothetical protein EMIHUDRAFT_228708 [Emiliania huxleyi CCMP1516]EOD34098.1 hypothetical protein EMIHUDRAFT_228708 [Emiliania huxleyi CCMP1516]|eukprot:XP_005786527.1 hypothetical protein EMIHUDRAFT_228708 [Emiliania huxleyi CCMP1516]